MATLPGGGPTEDGSELRSHACGVAKVEDRGHAPGVGRIVLAGGGVTRADVDSARFFAVTLAAGMVRERGSALCRRHPGPRNARH